MGDDQYRVWMHWYERMRYGRVLLAIIIIAGLYLVLFGYRDSPLTGNSITVGIGEVFLNPGTGVILAINFTNSHTDASNIRLELDTGGAANFDAKFLDHPLVVVSPDRKELNSSSALSPLEERTFEVEITAIAVEEATNDLTITGYVIECGAPCTESHTVRVHTMRIPEFPGLGFPALLILVAAAAVIYWKREK